MAVKTLDGAALSGKRVLVRVDLNVPMQDGRISDATRIERLLPTIREIADMGAKVVLLSHFDRPKGKPVPAMSLRPLAQALAQTLARPVGFATDCIGPAAASAVSAMANGDIVLLENTRFHPGEEANDPAFVAALASLGDAYVNDAFSAAHRAHASTEGLAHHLPAYAGRLMQRELEALEAALGSPKRPVLAIVGGSKVSTKLDLLGNLCRRVDYLVIGGAMANTFLAALGFSVGKSLQEAALHATANDITATASAANCRIVLPVDTVVAREFRPNPPTRVVKAGVIDGDEMILDVGPETTAEIGRLMAEAQTLVWNGPLGAFETPPFDQGTTDLARKAAALTRAGGLLSVAGGGDTVSALRHAGVTEDFSYVSTAGGAFLEWLEGKTLPGVAALAQ